LIAVLPDNKVAYLGPEDFEQLDFEKIKKEKKHHFEMRLVDDTIENLVNLDAVLN
jgi:hypothetical protein